MAVVQPDAMAVVLAVTFHGIVAEVALSHFLVGVDHDLSRRDIIREGEGTFYKHHHKKNIKGDIIK